MTCTKQWSNELSVMEDGRCLLDVINDENALTDFLSKDIPLVGDNNSNGRPLIPGSSASPADGSNVSIVLSKSIQVSTVTSSAPIGLPPALSVGSTVHQPVGGVLFPGAMSLPKSNVALMPQGVSIQPVLNTNQNKVQVSHVNLGTSVRTPVKILPQQGNTVTMERQGSPNPSTVGSVNVNSQIVGHPQGVTFLSKPNVSNNVNIFANVPGISQPVALQGTVIQTSTGSKILIQGNQLSTATAVNGNGQPQIAIRSQPSNISGSASGTPVQTLAQIAIKPQVNTSSTTGISLQTTAAGQPAVRLANFTSPAQPVVIQRGVSPNVFVRAVAPSSAPFQSLPVSTGSPVVNGQQTVNASQPSMQTAAAAQGAVTLSIPHGVNLQSLQGLNLEQLKKIPGISVISSKRPVQPKPVIKPTTVIPTPVTSTTLNTSSQQSSQMIDNGASSRQVSTNQAGSTLTEVKTELSSIAPVQGQAGTIFTNIPTCLTVGMNGSGVQSPVTPTVLDAKQPVTQNHQILAKIQNQLRQLSSLGNPTPEQANLIQKLQSVRQKILSSSQATPTAVSSPTATQLTSGDILMSLLGKSESGTIGNSAGATPVSGVTDKPPLLTQIKVGNQTISINLTPEQREKIQGQLSKLTPEQQQLFYKHQQALILKFHQQQQQQQQQKSTVGGVPITRAKQRHPQQPAKVFTVVRPSNQVANKQDISRLKRPPMLPNTPSNRGSIIVRQLGKDQENVISPDCTTPFRTRQESCKRLLRYHIFNMKDHPEEAFKSADESFEEMSEELIEKKNNLFERYRHLLWSDCMRAVPSPEMVLVHRLLHSDIKNKLEQERQSPPQDPEDLINATTDVSSQAASHNEAEVLNSESEIDITSEVTHDSYQELSVGEPTGDRTLSDIEVCDSPRLVVKIKRCGGSTETSEETSIDSNGQNYESQPKRTKQDEKCDDLKLKLKLDKSEGNSLCIPKLKISLRKEESESLPDLIDPSSDLVSRTSCFSNEQTRESLESLDDTRDYTEENSVLGGGENASYVHSAMAGGDTVPEESFSHEQPLYSDISEPEIESDDDDNMSEDTNGGAEESPRKLSHHSVPVEDDPVSYSTYSTPSHQEPDLMDYDSQDSVGFTHDLSTGGVDPANPLGLDVSYEETDREQAWKESHTEHDSMNEPEEVENAINSILGIGGDPSLMGQNAGYDLPAGNDELNGQDPSQDDLDAAVKSILM